MELKNYQKAVLSDLDTYLNVLLAQGGHLANTFSTYWKERGVLNQTYKNNVKGVPHVCVKVPTAGGKTYIAVNALDAIFNAFAQYNPLRSKFVVWLVPSRTILEQTVKNLSDVDHPYRQRLNVLFNGRVQIYEKADVLQGAGFNADSVREQLSIVVMTFDSLKGKSKEVLKAFQDNGYLASFLSASNDEGALLPEYDKTALINVIRSLKPVVVVDESHNAETALSVDMLQTLNPSFIFDLTATPRNNSNIISYIDALQLKKQNMVKLPVIVANQYSTDDVIMAALKMRFQLEEYARQDEANGGEYIRPIVLFQAEPKNNEDTVTFDKVKQHLIDLGVDKDEIAIKTANINELKGVDLMSRDCSIRYIITINALKEGWDCPFAYILATLANKSSVVDVTQILGRVLRMPYVRRHRVDYLNLSYVFTASSQFAATLDKVVAGLNKAGFSHKDYRVVDAVVEEVIPPPVSQQAELSLQSESNDLELGVHPINPNWREEAWQELAMDGVSVENIDMANQGDALTQIKEQALAISQKYELQAAQIAQNDCPPELESDMNSHKMKPNLVDSVSGIVLPQFFQKVATGGFFDEDEQWQKLSKNNLLSGFVLANLDANVSFENVDAEVYQVDVTDIGGGESSVEFESVNHAQKQKLIAIIRNQSNEGQIHSVVSGLFGLLGKGAFYPIEDNDVKKYLTRIVEAMSVEQRNDCLEKDYLYIKVIKNKINQLANDYAARVFESWLTIGKLKLSPAFSLPLNITPAENASQIAKSLYVHEGKINGFEQQVIQGIANLGTVSWWHRNLERGKGFEINGFINHYPDFMIMTERKNLILLETKGGDRDNSDSMAKLKLGKIWESQANLLSHETGLRYHYMMVFDNNPFDGALTLADSLRLINDL